MRLFDQTGLVSDSDGVKWECRWQRLEGYPIPKTTRVLLRRPGSDTDTHYVDAPWMANKFQPVLIDGDFVPLMVNLPDLAELFGKGLAQENVAMLASAARQTLP